MTVTAAINKISYEMYTYLYEMLNYLAFGELSYPLVVFILLLFIDNHDTLSYAYILCIEVIAAVVVEAHDFHICAYTHRGSAGTAHSIFAKHITSNLCVWMTLAYRPKYFIWSDY